MPSKEDTFNNQIGAAMRGICSLTSLYENDQEQFRKSLQRCAANHVDSVESARSVVGAIYGECYDGGEDPAKVSDTFLSTLRISFRELEKLRKRNAVLSKEKAEMDEDFKILESMGVTRESIQRMSTGDPSLSASNSNGWSQPSQVTGWA
jgi:hypothetical protein